MLKNKLYDTIDEEEGYKGGLAKHGYRQRVQRLDSCCRAGDRGGWLPSDVNDPGSSTRALLLAAGIDSDAPIVGDIVSV
jgi:hypothetical protein